MNAAAARGGRAEPRRAARAMELARSYYRTDL
jgi:hypothetical protein